MARQRTGREPRAHWAVLIAVLIGALGLLVVSGITGGQLGERAHAPASRPGVAAVPADIRAGGPIVDPSRPHLPGLSVPEKHVVLTFDDGPTKWTAKILDVLAARGVKATFFVIGSRVAERPDLVRRMYDEGHEVGVHTYTHANLANVPSWRRQVELDQTELAIASATGHTTDLLRPPYSSRVDAITSADWSALGGATRFRTVFADRDTRDWARPGVGDIVAGALPTGNDGAVVMMHDGGGDRSETVAGLSRVIDELEGRGYTFDTVTSAIDAPTSWHTATAAQRLQGHLVSGLVRFSSATVDWLRITFLVLAALAVLRTLLLLALARRHARHQPGGAGDRGWSLPPVSVVVPAYNEEDGIVPAVRSLAASDYPELEVVVVDDGSTDGTAALVEAFGLPNVRVSGMPNGGKSSALNTGVALARHDLIVMVDGDTVFESDASARSCSPSPTPRWARSPATSRSATGEPARRWQHIEYVIGFNLDRRLFDVLRCMPTVPGAIGAFRREALREVGGVSDETLAEDTDLTMAPVPGRLAGGLRGEGARLDRGAGHPGAAVATALPVELRHHAGDVEAPPVGVVDRGRVRAGSAGGPAVPAASSRCCCRCSPR